MSDLYNNTHLSHEWLVKKTWLSQEWILREYLVKLGIACVKQYLVKLKITCEKNTWMGSARRSR